MEVKKNTLDPPIQQGAKLLAGYWAMAFMPPVHSTLAVMRTGPPQGTPLRFNAALATTSLFGCFPAVQFPLSRTGVPSLLLLCGHVELEVEDVSVLHQVRLTLLPVLARLFHCGHGGLAAAQRLEVLKRNL